jgi:putative zinc finger protein
VHPFAELSAYLDGALEPRARASVEAHLGTCAVCRARLADLRGTARLIAGLPSPAPARSLVPHVSVPFWLAPLRTASAIASGLAVILFVVSIGAGLTQQAGTAAPAVDRNAGGAAASSAVPANAPAAGSPGAQFGVGPSPTSGAGRTAVDSAKVQSQATSTPSTAARQDTGASGPQAVQVNGSQPAGPSAPSSFVWLGLAVVLGALAVVATWRLRAA